MGRNKNETITYMLGQTGFTANKNKNYIQGKLKYRMTVEENQNAINVKG